jgi:hypothetical protein
MGWVLAIILVPIIFAVIATYVVLKLAVLLRLIFAPVVALRRW